MIKALRSNQKGLSLLEILVAVFILAIVAVPMLGMFSNNLLLLMKAYEKTDATYDAKSMIENLYPLAYEDLFKEGTGGTPVFDAASGKYYTIELMPSGPTGAVSGTPCFMHLFVSSGGAGKFVGPDGKLMSGSLASVNIGSIELTADKDGTAYILSDGTTTVTGIKPAGATPVLIVVSQSGSALINITAGDAAVIVYAPVGTKKSNLTVNALDYHLFINDAPPTTMLVTALMKTYTTSSTSTQESVFQDTLTVGMLP